MTTSASSPALTDLPDSLPIFPLAGALLLPGGRLPLNIFEPRYLEMFHDAVQGDRLIGMIQPTEDEVPGAAPPKLYSTGCAGQITDFSETEDGRYLVTLTGLIRFTVSEELPSGAYRRVRPDYSRFAADPEPSPEHIEREALLAALRRYFEAQSLQSDWSAIEAAEDESLINSLAMVCPLQPAEKQVLLEAMTLGERADKLRAILEIDALSTGEGGGDLAH